jgi:glutathione synthase/RimK-type ligase-like ATP-grasp enzyme
MLWLEPDWLTYEANRRKRLVKGELTENNCPLRELINKLDLPDDKRQDVLGHIENLDTSMEATYKYLCELRSLAAVMINQQKITKHNDKVRFVYQLMRHIEGVSPEDENETISPQQIKFVVSGV